MKPGFKLYDSIRVRNWPGTRGMRFTVIGIDERRRMVHALDHDYRTRTFPLDQCEAVTPRRGAA